MLLRPPHAEPMYGAVRRPAQPTLVRHIHHVQAWRCWPRAHSVANARPVAAAATSQPDERLLPAVLDAITAFVERADSTEPLACCDSSDRDDIEEPSEPTDRNDPTLKADPNDPMLTRDSTEPVLPIDSTEPSEAMDSTESSDHSEKREATDAGMVSVSPHGRGESSVEPRHRAATRIWQCRGAKWTG